MFGCLPLWRHFPNSIAYCIPNLSVMEENIKPLNVILTSLLCRIFLIEHFIIQDYLAKVSYILSYKLVKQTTPSLWEAASILCLDNKGHIDPVCHNKRPVCGSVLTIHKSGKDGPHCWFILKWALMSHSCVTKTLELRFGVWLPLCPAWLSES